MYLFNPTSRLAIQWHSFDRLLESCIQTSSVKANFSVGVTRTKILLYWLKDFHFQPWNYRKLQREFFPRGRKNGSWMESWVCSVVWQAWVTCMIWALIDYIYIYILSIHCLRFYALCWDSTVHELMWRLRGFHLLLLSDKFHRNFCFPDPPKKLFKKKNRTLHYYVGIYMDEFFFLKHYGQYLNQGFW